MKRKKKKIIGLVSAILVIVLGGSYGAKDLFGSTSQSEMKTTVAKGEMSVSFLDIGQGDSTLIQTGTQTMLIDAGGNSAGETVVTYLKEHQIEKLDYLILTHPDEDHVGGADTVIANIDIDKIMMPDVEHDTLTFADVKTEIEKKQTEVVHPKVGEQYTLGDASFTILCPKEVTESDLNNSSIGIKLIHGAKSFVLCGDAEEPSEKAMVEQFGENLESDVLKCGHHGSNTATSDEFLEAVNPTWAVISCGEGNRYGHPHAEVVAKLQDADIQIYRTDELGTIVAVSDGENIAWSHFK